MTAAPGRAKIEFTNRSSDPDLIQGCLKGDETAWAALIGKYKNLIFSIPIRYGVSEEDAADIFQAVCLDLLAELPSLREPQAVAGWLIQVARNKCFHRKQSQQRQDDKTQELDDLDSHASPAEPERVSVQLEQEQLLHDALVDLSPRCQQLVRMLFFETPARPYQQVAQELDLAEGSIGFIRRRCLNKLRQRLESQGFHLL